MSNGVQRAAIGLMVVGLVVGMGCRPATAEGQVKANEGSVCVGGELVTGNYVVEANDEPGNANPVRDLYISDRMNIPLQRQPFDLQAPGITVHEEQRLMDPYWVWRNAGSMKPGTWYANNETHDGFAATVIGISLGDLFKTGGEISVTVKPHTDHEFVVCRVPGKTWGEDRYYTKSVER